MDGTIASNTRGPLVEIKFDMLQSLVVPSFTWSDGIIFFGANLENLDDVIIFFGRKSGKSSFLLKPKQFYLKIALFWHFSQTGSDTSSRYYKTFLEEI